jgi:uncharacterized protein HemY
MDRKSKIEEFLKQQPDSSFLLFALAKEWEAEQNDENAIATYQQIVRNDPKYTGTYYHLGKIFVQRGEYQMAREIFIQGLEACKLAHAIHDANELQAALDDLES